MDFSLTDEQKMLVNAVRQFIRNELKPLEDEIEAKGQLDPAKAQEIFQKSKALGFYAMNMPEEYGGGGLSAVDTMLVEEQFGHTTDILIRRAFGNVYEALLVCKDAQKERWLLPTVQGERTVRSPLPSRAPAPMRPASAPCRQGRLRLVAHGAEHFVSDGEYSDFFIVSAVTDPDSKPRGISLFLVDKAAPGLSVGRNQAMMGSEGPAISSCSSTR